MGVGSVGGKREGGVSALGHKGRGYRGGGKKGCAVIG